MTSARPRAGFSLVELLVAATLAGIVAAAAAGVVARQARGYAALATRARVAASADAAVDVAAIARWAAPADLRTVADSLLELRAFIGTAPACIRDSSSVDVDADGPAASWLAAPRAGDLVVQASVDSADTTARTIVAVAAAPACSAPAAPGYRLTLDAPLAAAATARVLRDTRFLLYQSSDRLWYLGAADRDASGWSTIQPVSGPYAAPTDGLGLRFASLGSGGMPAAGGATRALRVRAAAVADDRSTAAAHTVRTSIVALRNAP